MLTLRSLSLPVFASIALLAQGVLAQDPSPQEPQATLEQIHPRTMIVLGLGFGDEDVEINTGPGGGIASTSTEATHIRLRGEHFFRSNFGVFFDGFIRIADDIDENLGSPDSSWDSSGLFAAISYRATMGEAFRLPVRFGPFIHTSEQDDVLFTDGAIERSMFGVRLSAEPEVILSQTISNGRVSELSAFAEVACGAGPAKVEDNVDSEDAYAFTLGVEFGLRYKFAAGILVGLAYHTEKYHFGASESYNNPTIAFNGIDDDFSGVMITAGVRF